MASEPQKHLQTVKSGLDAFLENPIQNCTLCCRTCSSRDFISSGFLNKIAMVSHLTWTWEYDVAGKGVSSERWVSCLNASQIGLFPSYSPCSAVSCFVLTISITSRNCSNYDSV